MSCSDAPEVVVPWRACVGDDDLALLTTVSAIGTPAEVTLSELTIEMFFAAYEATERALWRHLGTATLP